MNETFYLLIAGSRGFAPNERFQYKEEILSAETIMDTIGNAMLKTQLEAGRKICIVHGNARGADTVGKQFGQRHGYDVKAFPAKWDLYGRSAGYIRNGEMYDFLKDQEHSGALLFWDGTSRGTKNNFLQAFKRGVNIKCFKYLEQRFMTQEEMHDVYLECRYE